MTPPTVSFRTPQPQPQKNSFGWMLLFTDLTALLLAFFVLLFSMSQVKVDAWQALVDSVSRRFNPTEVDKPPAPEVKINIPEIWQPKGKRLGYLEALFAARFDTDPLLSRSLIRRFGDRLVISMPSDLLFEGAETRLTEEARAAAHRLSEELGKIGNQVIVVGHTAPVTASGGGEFASKWELSLARAVAFANALRQGGYARPVATMGYADTRFSEIPSDLPLARRHSLARRVDVVIGAARARRGE